MLAIVLIVQTTTAAAPPERIDVLVPRQRCLMPSGDDVVVCARDPETDRLRPLPSRPVTGPPDGPLSFRLPGGGTGKVEAMQTALPGAIGQGARVSLRIPLGKRARPVE